jgi:DNA-binding beta-propeller fold protein YncE
LLRAGFPYLKTLGMRRITNFPADVAIGGEGRIYVLLRNDGAAVIRPWTLDDAEKLTDDLGTIGGIGKDEGQFTWPVALIADHEENLFVSDEYLHRISSFNRDGEFLGMWGESGNGDGQLNRPSGIAFDPEENLYVVDTKNHRVQKFTKDGKFLMKWGSFGAGEGQFNSPWGITVDELGDVYVVDWRNDRLQKFTADGEFIFSIGRSGSKDGEFNRPTGVAVDKDGDIYVADCGNNRVQLFNEEGRYVQKFLGDATLSRVARTYMLTNAYPNRLRDIANLEQEKYLRSPRSVRVDDEGRMYVPDYKSYRVQVYQKEAIPLDEHEMAPPVRSPTLQTT